MICLSAALSSCWPSPSSACGIGIVASRSAASSRVKAAMSFLETRPVVRRSAIGSSVVEVGEVRAPAVGAGDGSVVAAEPAPFPARPLPFAPFDVAAAPPLLATSSVGKSPLESSCARAR